MKFVCDQMLAGLGKWLRAAGYDTIIIDISMPDQKILEYAQSDNRLLITRDIHFLKMNAAKESVVFLSGNSIEECIHELSCRLKINWLYRPFSRCLVCNSGLIEADYSMMVEQVPADVLMEANSCCYCEQCQKIYWEGSHTKRMREKLQAWQQC